MPRTARNDAVQFTTAACCPRCGAAVYYGTPVVWFIKATRVAWHDLKHGAVRSVYGVQFTEQQPGCPKCPQALQQVLMQAVREALRELNGRH